MGLCLEVTNSHHSEYVHKIILKSFNINRRYRPDNNSYIPKILHINFVLSSCNFDGGPTFASGEENISRDWENLDTTVTCLNDNIEERFALILGGSESCLNSFEVQYVYEEQKKGQQAHVEQAPYKVVHLQWLITIWCAT